MPKQRVGVAAECICDLPKSYLKEHKIGVLYFLVQTNSGVFTDTDEITAENVISYMERNSGIPISAPPPPDVYVQLFEDMLEKYEEVLFVTTGRGASFSYEEAMRAWSGMGEKREKVRIFNSGHLSTGTGHVVVRAVEMAEAGASMEEILPALEDLKNRVTTSFIAMNADYLYRNGKVPFAVKRLCDTFGIHPVLKMKNDTLGLKTILLGNYEQASLRYVRRTLKREKDIDKTRIFLTHVGCSSKRIERIKEEILRRCKVEELIVTQASATVSSNSGPGTFGVLFVREK